MLRVGIDIGVTFTDFAAWRDNVARSQESVSYKVLSSAQEYARAFMAGFAEILSRIGHEAGEDVYVIHGTTVSTNRVIERSGAAVALLSTACFRDVLELQQMKLTRLLDMMATRTPSLVPRQLVFEIDERLYSDGSVCRAIDIDSVVDAAT
ncbi:MAG: N-methylhydantoinase A [Gammaproteobacteria bacterium]|jgi:N-methylhydantoinase A